jgi:hypothetical protein
MGRRKTCLRQDLGQAPRGDHSANQPFVEVGAWRITNLRRGAKRITFYPWTPVEDIPTSSPAKPKAKRDPLALARHYQALLDSGKFKNQAELARHLNVSQARVSQVLRRLKTPSDDTTNRQP